jgi:hypothetical protein
MVSRGPSRAVSVGIGGFRQGHFALYWAEKRGKQQGSITDDQCATMTRGDGDGVREWVTVTIVGAREDDSHGRVVIANRIDCGK